MPKDNERPSPASWPPLIARATYVAFPRAYPILTRDRPVVQWSFSGPCFTFIDPAALYLEMCSLCSAKAKMEVSTKEAMNPIAQDIKKGKLR